MMQRYLILTTVDVQSRSNNREHQIIAHLAPRFDETWVVYRRRCSRGTFGQIIRDALVPWARTIDRNGVKFVEVNPLFNHFEGMAIEASGYREFDSDAIATDRWVRRLLFVAISGLGILKDISTMFFLGYFAWRRCPGKFDVATALGPWGAIPGIALRKMQRVRSLVYEDRDYEPGFIRTPLRRRWASWLERVAMREADRVIAIGGRLANLRRRQTGRAIDIVPTGVDLARFARVERNGPRPVLIYTGNVAPWSGLDVVLKAMPRIRLDVPAIQCVFVGSGLPHVREHLEQLANELGIREAVQFIGQVPYERVNSYLAEAGIGLALFQPTELRQYAAPLKVLEYMAAGLPTIATHHSEAADLLAAEDCGLASNFNADAFAGAVLNLLRDDRSYSRMSANARRSAERFDWSKLMTDEYNLLDAAWRRGRTKT